MIFNYLSKSKSKIGLHLSLGSLAVGQVIVAFSIQFIVLRIVGAGRATDAYVAAQAAPLVLYSIIATALLSVWQPKLAVAVTCRSQWSRLQGVAQGQVIIAFLPATMLLLPTSSIWAPYAFPGFNAFQIRLVGLMSIPLFIGALFNAAALLLTAGLRARDQFIYPEMVSLVGGGAAVVATLLLVPRYGLSVAAWLWCVRYFCVWLALFIRAETPVPRLVYAFLSADEWKQAGPLLGSGSLYKASPLIDRFWSSQAPPGAVSIFGFAQSAIGAVNLILDRAISTPIIPQLSRHVASGEWRQVKYLFRGCIGRTSLICGLIALMLFLMHPFFLYLAHSYLKFGFEQSTELWTICLLLIGYLYVASGGTTIVATFYAMGNTATPAKLSIAGFIVGLVLKAVGFIYFGIVGLAAATSLGYLFNFAVGFFLLERLIVRQSSVGRPGL